MAEKTNPLNFPVPCVIKAVSDLGESNVVMTEETIEKNFKEFRSYIETCVKVTDLTVFYDLFTIEQTRKYRQLFRVDPTAATTMAFDDIVQLKNQPKKYTHLLTAMEAAGYPKIVRILKGELAPLGSVHRKVIRRSFRDISQNLMLMEVLPHLLAKDVINQDDYEEIMAAERNHCTGYAATELLLILPNRHKDWFKHFMDSLKCSSHDDLAKSIDERFKSMENLERFDDTIYEYDIDELPRTSCKALVEKEERHPCSCEDVDNIPKHRANRKHRERFLMPQRDRTVHQKRRQNDIVDGFFDDALHGASCQTAVQKAESILPIVIETHPPGIESSNTFCSPCQNGDVLEKTTHYCTDCSEPLCEKCMVYHLRMKLARDHEIIECFPESVSPDAKSVSANSSMCGCGIGEKEFYCEKHEDFVCSECKTEKHYSCNACPVEDLSDSSMQDKLNSVSETITVISRKLDTFLAETDEAHKILSQSIRKCREDVKDMLSKITDHLEEIMTDIDRIEQQEEATIEAHIEACRFSKDHLSQEYKRTQEYIASGEKGKALDSVLQLKTTLNDTKFFLSEIDQHFKSPYVIFKANDKLVDIMAEPHWGGIEIEYSD